MNISFCNKDEVRGTLKLEIGKADYTEKVEKKLRNLRMSATVPGFRKGAVPMGIVQKKFGKQTLWEELSQIVSDALTGYLDDNPQIKSFGQPLPSLGQPKLDLDTQEDFDFFFDIAFLPEINIDLSKDDVLPYFQAIISDEMVNDQISNYQRRYGSYEEATEVSEEDIVKGTMTELENGLPKEGGIIVEDATFLPVYMKVPEEINKIVGAKKGTTIVFNPRKAFEGSTSPDAEIASLLAKAQEDVAGLESDFSFEIKSVTRCRKAELEQPFFDKIFGEGVISNEDEFRQAVKEILIRQLEPQSDYKFLSDLRSYLLDKADNLPMADDIIKRYFIEGDKTVTEEEVEAMYPDTIRNIKFNMVVEHILQKNGIPVDVKDLAVIAEQETRASFARYGMAVNDDVVNSYAINLLNDKSQTGSLKSLALNKKLQNYAKGAVTLDIKEISLDDFDKLLQADTSEEEE